MVVMTEDSGAQSCYRAASIAARIHYSSKKELESCSYALNRSAMTQRDRAATLTNRGIIFMALGEYDAAIQDFTGALKLNPEFGEIHVNIGNIYFLDSEFDKAIGEYSAAIDTKAARVHIAHINRGMAYENLGDFDSAEKDYREAMILIPDSALPQLKLDQLFRKKADINPE